MENLVKRVDVEKNYVFGGAHFTVQVERAPHLDRDGLEFWNYVILVKGNVIESNVYSWPRDRRPLTNNGACNHIASFWGPSDLVKNSQDLEPTYEVKLAGVVDYCMKFLQTYLMQENFHYDIIHQMMDENGWDVIIRPDIPKIVDNRIFMFSHNSEYKDTVVFESYVEDRHLKLSIPL